MTEWQMVLVLLVGALVFWSIVAAIFAAWSWLFGGSDD